MPNTALAWLWRALLALWLLALPTLANAEVVFPKGGGVGLSPPRGMAASQGAVGFQGRQATILITEIPKEVFAQIGAAREAMAARAGGTSAYFAVKGAAGFIVRGRQTTDGRTYRKWAVVLSGEARAAMVTALVPVEERGIADASIEAALRSITFR